MSVIYDKEIKARMDEAERLVAAQDEGLFDTLSSLLEVAEREDDPALRGFVHFQYASAYFDMEDADKMLDSVHEALSSLLISDSREWISRAYNLFSVYAKQVGCLDMSYNYLLFAHSFVDDIEGSTSRAIIEANIGDLMADMQEYRKACTYVRKSLKTLKKCKKDSSAAMYMAFSMVNLGLFLLYAGEMEKARKTLVKGQKMLGEYKGEAKSATSFWYTLVEVQLELAEGNRERMLELTAEVADMISTMSVFALFATELHRFGSALIAASEWDAVKILLDGIESTDTSSSSVYSRLMIARLKADHHKAMGEREQLAAAREERHLLSKELEETRKKLFYSSAKLMLLNEEVKKERDRIRRENERLHEQALTDALTGLPNRYALNEKMEHAFDKAVREHKMFGFGIVDIDAFKQYNDSYGHAAGDECLISVANTLREIASEYGFFVSRYGGDEFTMIYENMDIPTIEAIENKILDRVSVSVSHGFFADIPDWTSRRWDYLTRADRRMYKMKRGDV